MSAAELLQIHRCQCRECQTGFCTPATMLQMMVEIETQAPAPTTTVTRRPVGSFLSRYYTL